MEPIGAESYMSGLIWVASEASEASEEDVDSETKKKAGAMFVRHVVGGISYCLSKHCAIFTGIDNEHNVFVVVVGCRENQLPLYWLPLHHSTLSHVANSGSQVERIRKRCS